MVLVYILVIYHCFLATTILHEYWLIMCLPSPIYGQAATITPQLIVFGEKTLALTCDLTAVKMIGYHKKYFRET